MNLLLEKFTDFKPTKEDVERNTLFLYELIVKVFAYFKVNTFENLNQSTIKATLEILLLSSDE